MRVFIAGATGVLGRELIRQFSARGDTVVGLTRGQEGARTVEALGGESRQGDIFDSDSLARAAEGSDVVIHAATSIPTKPKTSARDWEMNDRLRREGTRALTDCAAKIKARLYLQQSVVWVARPPDGSFFDEDSEPRPEWVYRSAHDGEKIALEAGHRGGFQVSVLRCGAFYGADAAHTVLMGEGLRKRKLPIIGDGAAVWSCLHTEDAAGAFVAAAEATKSGLWHVVDDYPVTVRELLLAFAERLGAPAPRRVPVWLARLFAGELAVKMFTSSTRTSNARFRRDFGWSPRFPTHKEGLDDVVRAWRAKGAVRA